jgi:tetratricopeptide (TPR) repeat protein
METSGQDNLNVGINKGTILNQTIVPQPRKASLFQLPADSPDFTGRSAVTTQIETILDRSRIVTIFGMGGVGKSTLARHVGNRLKAVYPDGQLVVDLRRQSESPMEQSKSQKDWSAVQIAVLTEFLVDGFGDDPQHLPTDLDRLQNLFNDRLTGRKILVVLDNAADAAQVEPLLPRVSGCGAIVTSREKLANLSGLTAESFVPIDVMPIEEAIALLNQLCPDKTQDSELTAKLAELCGRLPLALTIVGRLLNQTASLTLVKLIPELAQERSRLQRLKVRNTRDEIEAKLDVEASFNLSYQRLLPEQQQVFVAVSVLRGVDFGVALAAVLGEMDEALVQRRLDQLVALALVQMPEGKDDRYCFHDLMREFGRGKLEPEQEAELGMKALGWYDDQATTFNCCLTPTHRRPIAEGLVSEWEQPLETIEQALDAMASEWFSAERSNLIGAVNWLQDLSEHQMAVRLTANLAVFFQRKALWNDWGATHQVALKSARAIGDNHGIAQTMNNLGNVYQSQGKWDEAIDCYQQSLEIMRAIGDQHGIAQTIGNLGNVYQSQGKWEAAIDCYQQSLETKYAIGDQYGIAQTIMNIGNIYKAQGKWEAAIDCYQQSLETMRAIGDQHGIAQTMNNLGGVYQSQGKWEAAIDCYQQDLEISRAIGDNHGIAQTMNNLGLVYQDQGKWEEAIDCYQQSLETKRAIGDNHGISVTMMNIGNVYQAQGKWEEAIDCYQQSLETMRAIGDIHGISQSVMGLGNVYKAQGKWEEAIDCYQQSLETKRAIGDHHGIAQTMNNLGLVYKAQGKWEEAIDCYQQSIQSSHQIGDPQTEANGWYNLGDTQAKLGNPAARTSYQNAKVLFQQLKLTNYVEMCDNAISTIGQSTRLETLTRAPKIGDDRAPRKKKRSFPLWQSAIVLLLLGIGWMAMKPQAPAQNGEVRMQK